MHWISLGIFAVALLQEAASTRPDGGTLPPAKVSAVRGPLTFEANRGQIDPAVRYLSRADGYTVFLTDQGAVLALSGAASARGASVERSGSRVAVGMRLGGAPRGRLEGLELLEGRSHYFRGHDPRGWRLDIPHFGRVRHRDVYPGVDVVYYGRGRQLEFDLVLAPGADPGKIELAFEGAQGVQLDAAGDVLVSTAVGPLRLAKPVTYQDVGGRRRAIAAEYLLKPGGVGVRVGAFDASRPLVIDPVLSFVQRLGGAADDFAYDVAVDSAGNVYIAGKTASVNFPIWPPKGLCLLVSPALCAFQMQNAGATDAFVRKIDPSGLPVYSTYLGGAANDWAEGIAVDSAGNAYVTGQTSSLDFPTTSSAYQPEGDCGVACTVDPPGMMHPDAFITKLNAFGRALLYSTYLGSPEFDAAKAIAVDSRGRAFVTGETNGQGFPTKGRCANPTLLNCPFDSEWNGGKDTFVASLDPALEGTASLLYSSYLGGGGSDAGEDIAIRELTTKQGEVVSEAYVTGGTNSDDFPRVNAMQDALRSYPDPGLVSTDAFVTRFTSSGSALLFSTYLGGRAGDIGYGIAVPSAGTVWVTGQTNSSDFPVKNAYQPLYGGPVGPGDLVQGPPQPGYYRGDAFVARFDGNDLVYSTFLGGASGETGRAVALDGAGNVIVVGISNSPPPPSSVPAVRPVQEPCGLYCYEDGFVAKLSPDGSRLLYFTPLGGPSNDAIEAVAVDGAGGVIVAGSTYGDFPGTQPPQYGSQNDAIVARLFDPGPGTADLRVDHCASDDPSVTCAPPDAVLENGVLTYHVRITNSGPDPATEVALIETIAREATLVLPVTATQGTCYEEALGKRLVCRIGSLAPGDSATVTYRVTPNCTGVCPEP